MRPNCGGIWASATWAQSPWGSHIQCGLPATRTNCGGIWASATWAQASWATHIQCGIPTPPVDTRTNCGGIWASATWAQASWGTHIQCPPIPVPPVPPVPPTPGIGGGGFAARGRRRFRIEPVETQPVDLRELAEKPDLFERDAKARKQDDEDLLLIISLWLSIK